MIHGVTSVSEKQQQRPGVVIYRPQDSSGASHQQLAEAGCRVRVVEENGHLDREIELALPVHALLAASLRGAGIGRRQLEAMPDLRIISKYTIGVDDVDIAAATDLGILVTHCPTEANWGGVAEGTIALMLALLKKIQIRDRRIRAGGWRSDDLQGTYLGSRADGYPGISVGIIGLGRVGRRVARLLAPWQVRLLATDPYIDAAIFREHDVEAVSLDELLRQSDVVTLHCPLTDETDGLIGIGQLARMKPEAVLINTARGRIVDVDAVCEALDANRLGGAAFDVLPEEPPAPGARILESDERVILSPHMIAANRGGTLVAAIPWATEAVLSALNGKVPPHVYNDSVIDRWKARFADRPLLGA
jgi:phosphoglycerate dehydrogenase-like enzyme